MFVVSCAGQGEDEEALLKGYLRRIDAEDEAKMPPSPEALALLQRKHVHAVPFENLDMHAEPERRHIEVALVHRTVRKIISGRGGYCYELNSSFHWLLKKLGYNADMVQAIVGHPTKGFTDVACMDFAHMCLQVKFGGAGSPQQRFLADVGFQQPNSRCATLEPISLDKTGQPQRLQHFVHREEYMVVPQGDIPGKISGDPGFDPLVYKYLQIGTEDTWNNGYLFNLQPREHAEFQECATWEQTAKESPFTRGLLCTMPASFRGVAELAARLGCPKEKIDFGEGGSGHCQLSLTGSFARGARLTAVDSRTGQRLFDGKLDTRQEINQALRRSFGLPTTDWPFAE